MKSALILALTLFSATSYAHIEARTCGSIVINKDTFTLARFPEDGAVALGYKVGNSSWYPLIAASCQQLSLQENVVLCDGRVAGLISEFVPVEGDNYEIAAFKVQGSHVYIDDKCMSYQIQF